MPKKGYLLVKDFVLCPPVTCIENNNICINPFLRTPAHMVHLENIRHIGRGMLWRSSLRHQKWIPVILHSAIVVLEPASSKIQKINTYKSFYTLLSMLNLSIYELNNEAITRISLF